MVLPRLDGSFGCISTVDVWWDALEIDVVLFECFLEFIRALIVEDVEFRGVPVGLELFVETGPGGGELAGLAGLEWLRQYDVAVVIVEDHYVVIAARRLDGELAGLIGVRFL